MARQEQDGEDPDTVTLRIALPGQVARDLVALAELYHATPERMVASWAQAHVENLMAGLTPGGAESQPDFPSPAPARSELPPDAPTASDAPSQSPVIGGGE